MALAPFIAPSSAFDRRTLGKYEVLCRLSAGGMSEIFLAYQKGLAGFRKVVVLKSILPDIRGEEEFVRMFLDEAKTTAAFNHPNIAQVFDLDVDEGTLFLAMEFVQGCTLVEMARACRQAKEPIPVGLTLTAVRDTALALHYAHSFTDPRGRRKVVIHRDVAEKNIMVTYEGTTKLLDFGIAKAVGGAHRTTVGMVKGTSGYMSPEQIRGEELDPRSDIFSLGVVMHECLTGMRLFHGKNAEEGMLAALREEVAPPSKQNSLIPAAVDAVVLKALRRHRDDRFGTALEFARAIEKAGAGMMWHPEQIGDLVQRYFTDRREQTRGLIEQAQASGDPSGEIRIDKLLAMQTRPPANPLRLATPPPKVSAPPAPSPPVPARASVPPPVASHPAPFPRQATPAPGGALHKKPSTPGISPPPALRALQNQERLVTPVVTTIPPQLQANYSAGESTKEVTAPSSSFATPSDDLLDDDENDVGVKTVIADVSPVGPQRNSPAHEAITADGQSPVLVPPSSQMLTPLARPSMPGARPTQPAQPKITEPTPDDEDDSPGLKTTLALPFPPQPATPSHLDAEPKTASDVVTHQYQPRFNPVTVAAVGAVVLAVLLLIMAVLRIGFFSSTTNPPEVTLDTTVYSNSSKARQPNKAFGSKPAPKAIESPVEKPVEKAVVPVVAAEVAPPAPAAVAPVPPPTEGATPPVAKAPVKSAPAPVRKVRAPKKAETADNESELEDMVVPGKAFGDLTLATEPSGVVVIHNGRELGTTPLVKARIPVGKQTLKFKGPNGESKSLTFEMRANETKSLRVDLEDL
ncbi:MAG: protein kinase [Myxococcaceae bacterium]|nr:protein kinase [Myxococcaceae bacterium]